MNKRGTYEKGNPEDILCEFLYFWKEKNYEKMVELSNPIWRKFHRKPIEAIKNYFDFFELDGGVIQSCKKNNKAGVSYRIKTKLFLIEKGIKRTDHIDWLVHYESEKGKLNLAIKAVWSVNPLSGAQEINKKNRNFLKEDYEAVKEQTKDFEKKIKEIQTEKVELEKIPLKELIQRRNAIDNFLIKVGNVEELELQLKLINDEIEKKIKYEKPGTDQKKEENVEGKN